jgi:hypothetical protein
MQPKRVGELNVKIANGSVRTRADGLVATPSAKYPGECPRRSPVRMTNASLRDQGMLSLETLWAELAPLRRIA